MFLTYQFALTLDLIHPEYSNQLAGRRIPIYRFIYLPGPSNVDIHCTCT